MKISLLPTLLMIGLALTLVQCQPGNTNENTEESSEPAPSQSELKSYVEAMEDTLAMAYNKKSVELFERFYGEGAVTYGEGREQLFGKKAIVNHFRQNVSKNENFNATFEYHTLDVFGEGNHVLETGKWVEKDSTGKEQSHGFYMVLFEKQDGRYVTIRDIWNSATAEEPGDLNLSEEPDSLDVEYVAD